MLLSNFIDNCYANKTVRETGLVDIFGLGVNLEPNTLASSIAIH